MVRFLLSCIMIQLLISKTSLAASALSGQSLCRNILGAILPLFANTMYTNLGYQWASFVPSGIGFLLSLTPYVLFVYGPKLRQKVSEPFSFMILCLPCLD